MQKPIWPKLANPSAFSVELADCFVFTIKDWFPKFCSDKYEKYFFESTKLVPEFPNWLQHQVVHLLKHNPQCAKNSIQLCLRQCHCSPKLWFCHMLVHVYLRIILMLDSKINTHSTNILIQNSPSPPIHLRASWNERLPNKCIRNPNKCIKFWLRWETEHEWSPRKSDRLPHSPLAQIVP